MPRSFDTTRPSEGSRPRATGREVGAAVSCAGEAEADVEMEGSAATSVEVVLSGPQARKNVAVAAETTRIVPLGLCLIEYQTIDGLKWLDQGA